MDSDDWLNRTCECASLIQQPKWAGARLCSPNQKAFKFADIWNTYAGMYEELHDSLKGTHRSSLHRYEDLVLDPGATIDKIETDLKIPMSPYKDDIYSVMSKPSKTYNDEPS